MVKIWGLHSIELYISEKLSEGKFSAEYISINKKREKGFNKLMDKSLELGF
jgi:hypothetical protein